MEKILNYNTDLYNFKKYFEHFFECDLEHIHLYYGSKEFEWDGREIAQSKCLKYIVTIII